jgi:hypothetical protein
VTTRCRLEELRGSIALAKDKGGQLTVALRLAIDHWEIGPARRYVMRRFNCVASRSAHSWKVVRRRFEFPQAWQLVCCTR